MPGELQVKSRRGGPLRVISVESERKSANWWRNFGFLPDALTRVGREPENPVTGWLCWQSEANPSLPANGELQGDLAKLQGQCLHIPAEDRLHLSGLDGFLPNSGSRETIILSREGRIRITVPVFFEINSRVINGHPIANEGCASPPRAAMLGVRTNVR